MTVIIYGNEKDTSLNDILIRALTKYGGVQFYCKNKMICTPKECTPRFLVYDINKLPSIFDGTGIFVFKNSFKPLKPYKLPSNYLPVFDNQNLQAVKCLKNTDKIVMTCGMSPKNTLNFSSFNTTSAVVSLQRYIKIRNKVIEPHDFTVNLAKPFEPNALLMTCAVLLLSDIPSLNGYEF